MKKVLGLFLIAGLVSVYAAAPRFQNPVYVQANGRNIYVSYYGAPYAYDWDNDGKKDLLLGQFTSGKIRFYKNTGTNNAPVFGDSAFLRAGTAEITLPSG